MKKTKRGGRFNEDLRRVNQLAIKYHKSKQKVKDEILTQMVETFSSYLHKYKSIIIGDNIDLSNKETRRFLALYTGGMKFNENLPTIRYMFKSVSKSMEPEDIYHELVILFIEILNSYRKIPGVDFLGYFTKVFRWKVTGWLKDLSRKERPINITSNQLNQHLDQPELTSSWLLDHSTLLGILNPQDKIITVLKYGYDYPASQIATILETDEHQIKLRLRSIRTRLMRRWKREQRRMMSKFGEVLDDVISP